MRASAAGGCGPTWAGIAGLIVLAGWWGAVGRAAASAWNRAVGEGLVIVDYGAEAGDTFYDARGRLAPARRYGKGEAAAYVEYGATDRLMLLARPALDWVTVGAPGGGHYAGLGGASLGAQWQAMAFGPAVLAVQGSFGLPGSTARLNPAVVGNTSREADLRLLGGVGLPVPFRPFLDVQGAYRLRSGGAAAQWRADVTFGLHPTDDVLLLAQCFQVVPDGRGDAWNPAGRATRLDLKAVYSLSPAWAVQGGVFETVAGRNSLRERGVTAGIWRAF